MLTTEPARGGGARCQPKSRSRLSPAASPSAPAPAPGERPHRHRLEAISMNTTGNPGFAAVSAVPSLLSDLTVPYWIIGGWAIGLAVGRVTREHADVDVMMLERDKGAL